MNRRDLLKAAAPAAVASVGVGAVALPAMANPALAALLETASWANDRLTIAIEAKNAARAVYLASVGEPPALARFHGRKDLDLGLGGELDMATDYDRKPLLEIDGRGFENVRYVLGSERVLRELAMFPPKSRSAAHLRKRLAAVQAYERTKAEALEKSDVNGALERQWSAEVVVHKAARAVIDAEARTTADLAAKARALEWMRRADTCGGYFNGATSVVMADVLRICGGAT